jgi:hypothetical protein
VNHDLIAAGHPRLDFEFAAFLANMPAHWKPKDHEVGYDAKVWGVGQAITAAAALQLLDYRAAESRSPGSAAKPWPEFAEYGCYACHHDFQPTSPRQTPAHYQGRTPGSLPWGTWYLLPLAGALERQPLTEGGKAVLAQLKELRKLMEQPYPGREKAGAESRAIAARLQSWGEELARTPYDEPKVRSLLNAVAEDGRNVPDWDAATQHYLALYALSQALPRQEQARFASPLQALYRQLESPFRHGRYHSPRHFDPTQSADEGFLIELDKIRGLLKGP